MRARWWKEHAQKPNAQNYEQNISKENSQKLIAKTPETNWQEDKYQEDKYPDVYTESVKHSVDLLSTGMSERSEPGHNSCASLRATLKKDLEESASHAQNAESLEILKTNSLHLVLSALYDILVFETISRDFEHYSFNP